LTLEVMFLMSLLSRLVGHSFTFFANEWGYDTHLAQRIGTTTSLSFENGLSLPRVSIAVLT
jgi:hypothetical protein